METTSFKLSGLTCEACAKLATRYLEKIDGVGEVKVNLTGETQISADRSVEKAEVQKALADSDYKVA